MRRAHFLILLAWLLHAVSWFLPVLKSFHRGTITPVVRGWDAFFVALSALWPSNDMSFDSWLGAFLMGASAVTTILFILGSPWAVWRGSRSIRLASASIAALAFVVNIHWAVLPISDNLWSDLAIGYFCWWLSFAVLAAGFFDLARGQPSLSTPAKIATTALQRETS